jgi:hypothetical protein
MWWKRKARENPFDLDLALEIVDALAEEGFNLLAIDCADAVKYRSHPDLARRYTVPMSHLDRLASAARARGLDVVPKLNFSRSQLHHHNDWMLAPGETWHAHFDDAAYWERAFDLIDELIAVCQPKRYFHVGMDEDHDRSLAQYAEAIRVLHAGLKQRKLRTLIWNDTGIEYASGLVHAERSRAAEEVIPRQIIQVLWRYDAVPTAGVQRLRQLGFELWGAPGRRNPAQVRAFRDAVIRHGGKGLLMTAWIPCRKPNRRALLTGIHAMGPIYRGDG